MIQIKTIFSKNLWYKYKQKWIPFTSKTYVINKCNENGDENKMKYNKNKMKYDENEKENRMKYNKIEWNIMKIKWK